MKQPKPKKKGQIDGKQPWAKVWWDWYATDSHADIGFDALGLGPILMLFAKRSPEPRWILAQSGKPLALLALAQKAQMVGSPAELEKRVGDALERLAEVKTLERRDSDGAYGFTAAGWVKYQCPPSHAPRQADYRERKKKRDGGGDGGGDARVTGDVTPPVTLPVTGGVTPPVTPPVTPKVTEKPPENAPRDRGVTPQSSEIRVKDQDPPRPPREARATHAEERPQRFGRPVVPGEEVVRLWQEVMVPRGYPEAIDETGKAPGKVVEAIDDATREGGVHRNLDWWRDRAFPALDASHFRAERGDPLTLRAFVSDRTRLLDLVRAHEAAQRRPPPAARPSPAPRAGGTSVAAQLHDDAEALRESLAGKVGAG